MCPHQFSDAILNGTRARRRAFDGIEFAGAVGVLFEVECGSHSFFFVTQYGWKTPCFLAFVKMYDVHGGRMLLSMADSVTFVHCNHT